MTNKANSSNELINIYGSSTNASPSNINDQALNEKFYIYMDRILKYNGIFLTLLSAITITVSAFMIKLSFVLNASEMSSIKFLVQTIFCLPFMYFYKINLFGPSDSRLMLVLRGLAGSISIIAAYFSIKMINFSDSMSIRYSSPIVTALFASILLKEKLGIIHFASLTFSIIGVICVARPSFLFQRFGQSPEVENSTNFQLGLGLAFISALIGATTLVFIKKLTNKNIHFATIIFYYSLFGCLFSILITVVLYLFGYKNKWNSDINIHLLLKDISMSILAGAVNFFGHVSFIFALRQENINKIALIRTIDIYIAFLIEYFLLNLVPNWLTLVGSVFLLISILSIFIYKLILLKKKLIDQNFYA